jgi:hypothetical protein
MVQHSPFTGKEYLKLHLQLLIQLCQTFNMDGVTQDQMRVRLFPFSLHGKALQWFYSQLTETVQNWDTLTRAFMKEYYSPGKTQSLCNKIATFAQYPTETISEAFKRFNEYTRAVPHHKFPKGGSCSKVLSRTHNGIKDDHRFISGRIHHRTYADPSFHYIQEGCGQ